MVEIIPITLPLPYKMGTVNCYLVKTAVGFILIDTGSPNQRKALQQEIEAAGCKPGDLKLIAITHGDFDHIGNAAYLRKVYKAPIALHPDDSGMAEYGNMFWNRKSGGAFLRAISSLIPKLFGFGPEERFHPDLALQDGETLTSYGLDAQVHLLGGHSKGSIGILTNQGDLFCGDLIDNTKQPMLSSIMDDHETAISSLRKLHTHEVRKVFPGHGKPFPMEKLEIERII